MQSNSDAAVILCTVPNEAVAEVLATGLVEEGLAACVSVLPGVRSYYRWEGKLEVENEWQLLVKTRQARCPDVMNWLEDAHPFDVPELICLPIASGSAAYLRWITQSVS